METNPSGTYRKGKPKIEQIFSITFVLFYARFVLTQKSMSGTAAPNGTCSQASRMIPEAGGVVTDTQFTDVVEISFQIPGESLPALNRKLADATSGSVQAQVAGELFVEWKD